MKRVLFYRLEKPPLTVAEFYFEGDTVRAVYSGESARFDFEVNGITVGGDTLHPSDGRAFYDALDRAFAGSTHLRVECTDPGGAHEAAEPAVGTPAALDVTIGHRAGLVFKLKHAGQLADEGRLEGNIIRGRLAGWKRAAILIDGEHGTRFYVIEPAGEDNRVEARPFYARGFFRVVDKINNPRKAREAWKAFEPA